MYMGIAIIVWIFSRNDGGRLWNKGSILGAKTRSATKKSKHLTLIIYKNLNTPNQLLSNYLLLIIKICIYNTRHFFILLNILLLTIL